MSKPIEYMPSRMNLNLNYGLGVIMIYHCSFTVCNECALGEHTDNRKSWVYVGEAVHGTYLYLPLNFAVNLEFL